MALYKRGKVWWIKYRQNGVVLRESCQTTNKAAAKRMHDRRVGDVANGKTVDPKRDQVAVDDGLKRVLLHYDNKGRKSKSHAQRRIDKHLLPVFGGRRLSSLTDGDIQAYIARRVAELGEDASELARLKRNASINRELALLKLAFRLTKVPNRPDIEMLKEPDPRSGFFEREQFDAVLKQLTSRKVTAPIAPLATFFFWSGWRKSEVLSLEWRQVDFKTSTVTLDVGTTKNGKGRVLPFAGLDELRQTLEAQRDERDRLRQAGVICRWVFHRNGKQIKAYDTSWKTACRKAGVPGRIVHDFRRTACRNLVRAGVPEAVAMKITGHKTRSVFDRYNIVSDADLRDATQRLNAALTGQGTKQGTGQQNEPTTEAQTA